MNIDFHKDMMASDIYKMTGKKFKIDDRTFKKIMVVFPKGIYWNDMIRAELMYACRVSNKEIYKAALKRYVKLKIDKNITVTGDDDGKVVETALDLIMKIINNDDKLIVYNIDDDVQLVMSAVVQSLEKNGAPVSINKFDWKFSSTLDKYDLLLEMLYRVRFNSYVSEDGHNIMSGKSTVNIPEIVESIEMTSDSIVNGMAYVALHKDDIRKYLMINVECMNIANKIGGELLFALAASALGINSDGSSKDNAVFIASVLGQYYGLTCDPKGLISLLDYLRPLFIVNTTGYGFMRSYSPEIENEAKWIKKNIASKLAGKFM